MNTVPTNDARTSTARAICFGLKANRKSEFARTTNPITTLMLERITNPQLSPKTGRTKKPPTRAPTIAPSVFTA